MAFLLVKVLLQKIWRMALAVAKGSLLVIL